MSEPEIALVFTAEPWVEELHRHLSDHGGARVRSLIVEPSVALEESYDVLVVSHRWPALTNGFVADVRVRGRRVLGVCDVSEPASRAHLADVEVDACIESDAEPDAFVRAVVALGSGARKEIDALAVRPARPGRLVGVGGPPGAGSTEIAVELARSIGRTRKVVLVDCDDVAPSIAQRLALAVEPNLRTAIDAVEHGRGALAAAVTTEPVSGLCVVAGTPNAAGWAQVRPGEIMRVVDRLSVDAPVVVADGMGCLQDLGGPTRGRFATARALAAESDVLVAVSEATPVGVARLLAWAVDARRLARSTAIIAVVNRAPKSAFRRGELYEEIRTSLDVVEVCFVANDRRVGDAAWEGRPVARGPFTRGVARVAELVLALPRGAGELIEPAPNAVTV